MLVRRHAQFTPHFPADPQQKNAVREQKADDRMKFCGAGAIAMDDKENYAVLMRVAMLSALDGADITSNLGFRCAKPLPGKSK